MQCGDILVKFKKVELYGYESNYCVDHMNEKTHHCGILANDLRLDLPKNS